MSAKVAPDPNAGEEAKSEPQEETVSERRGGEENGTFSEADMRPMSPDKAPIKTNIRKRQSALFQFSNTEAIKEKVRANKLSPHPYDVKDLYHTRGCFQLIARNAYFENGTLAVIVLNALWLSVDTDGNTADTILTAEPVFVAADIVFFTYFSIELFIRFMAFKRKVCALRDPWFAFDTALVALYAFDPFAIGIMTAVQGGSGMDLPTSILRLFRLARLSRLTRMLRSLPELMIMIKGIVSATASVGYTMGLLLLVTYVFAIAMRNLVPAEEDFVPSGHPIYANEIWGDGIERSINTVFFSSVPEAMHTLIIFGTFLDELASWIIPVQHQSTPCFILSWVYMAIASLTVMNMLIGVLCEVISAVAVEEKESMMCDKVHEKFDEIVKELDKNGDGSLSWEEFLAMLEIPEALDALESVDVDIETMVDLAEDLFMEDGEPVSVTFAEFMEMVLDLRGGQEATVKDIMGLRKRFNKKFMRVKDKMDGIDSTIDSVDSKLDLLLANDFERAEEETC